MELTLDQALRKGIEAHKAGKAQEADRHYTAILKVNPKHSDANHNMGVLAVGVGKVETALPFFKTALETNSKIVQYWLSYIDALIKLDRMTEAQEVFDQAKRNGVKGDSFEKIKKALKIHPINVKNQIQNDIPTQPNILDEIKLDKAVKLAKKKIEHGFKEDAKKIFQDILEKFPRNKKALDGIKTLASENLAIKSDMQEAPSHQLQSILNLLMQGQQKKALTEALQLLKKFPNSITLYNIIGVGNQYLGNPEEAIDAYTKALSIKPDYADAYYNMGLSYQYLGKPEEAIDAYTKALSIKPDYADAYYNTGLTLQDHDRPGEAIEAYTKALSINPDYSEAYHNMGLNLSGMIFTKPNRDLQKTIISLLDKERYIRPKDIVKAAISLLKFEPNLKKHLKLSNDNLIHSPLDVISGLSKLPLLLKLMSVCPLPDLELESLLTNLRCAILSIILGPGSAPPELLKFQSALALQCFTNEYIYNHSEEEEEMFQTLEASVRKDLENNNQPSPEIVLALASYKALNEYDWCKLLVVTDHIKDVFNRQFKEPNQEEKLKRDLPILVEITDSISSEVRAQYEESPYPRWVNLGFPLKPLSISKVVDEDKLKLHSYKINEVEKPEILIAGCGTGQHSIGTATRFKSSKVLAIDLSLSSLTYAKRKTKEFRINNIEYMQADILDLPKLNKKFDIIESSGVLHHMENPMSGWKILTECLKPGGLMRIGLYSELARQNIVKIRREINQLGVGSSDAEMKSFRNVIIKSQYDHHKGVRTSTDFYSMSTLKDLLFHVQEHRFTIPQIKERLNELGLKFCGFETKKVISHFKKTYTNIDDPYDLDKWQAYEEGHPQVFSGMYQFWCQKVD